MLPRWLWFNHVPAGLDLTPEQEARVRRLVRELGPGQRRFTPLSRRMLARMALPLALVTVLFTGWIVWLVVARPGGRFLVIGNVAGIVLFNAALWVIIAWSFNRAVAPVVRRALNLAGVRVCESCGYILGESPRLLERCPECGAPPAGAPGGPGPADHSPP